MTVSRLPATSLWALSPSRSRQKNTSPKTALPAGRDTVRFGHQNLVEHLSPDSRTLRVLNQPGGITLNLRHWWPKDQAEPKSRTSAPTFLFIHGLSGRSAWMAPLVDELLKKPENQNARFYGLDLPNIGQHPAREGNIEEMSQLINTVRQAIEYLGSRQQGPVYAIGLSLGGLLLSSVAADNPPKALKAMTLISPAYKPHPEKASPKAYRNAVLTMLRSRLGKSKSEGVGFASPTPPPASSDDFTPLQTAIHRHKEVAPDRVTALTFPSYLKMFARMRWFRTYQAGKITIPARVYATKTDDLVDYQAIQQTFAKFASPQKELKIYPKALHDLILDPVNREMAEEIHRFFRSIPTSSAD